MQNGYTIEKLTRAKWANLYDVAYSHGSAKDCHWTMCSRKAHPVRDADQPDAVVIIATIETAQGRKLVVTKEFRVPIWDYEYGFPAGLIDDGEELEETIRRELKEETGLDLVKINHVSKPVYSSAGLTDESCCMAIVEATGQVSQEHLDGTEDIETLLMNANEIKDLLESDAKVAAKAWGTLYHYAYG